MNKAPLYCIAVLFLLLKDHLLFCQPVTFHEVASPTGNFSNLVGGIAQDKNGYMWIATSSGLYKYDGYRFKLFAHDPTNPNSLAENRLETVYVDRKGMIWIATWTHGLDRLDPVRGTFTHFRHDPTIRGSISDNTVRAILEDKEGTLWFGTNSGLDKFDAKTGKFHNYHYDPQDSNSLSCNRVRKLYEDRMGTLWIGTGSVWNNDSGDRDEGGLNRLDKKTSKFTRYLHDPTNPQSLINNKVQAILEDSRGTFWVGTAGDGLHTMDRVKGTFNRHLADPHHPQKLSRPPLTNILGTDHITFIAEDALGNIWIATLGNGIIRYDPKRGTTSHYTNKDTAAGFTDSSPWSFAHSRDGMFWIGTFQGRLFRVDPYQKYLPHVALGSRVSAIYEDSLHGTWVGTPEGLFLRSNTSGTLRKFTSSPSNPNSISNNHITSLFRDKEGILWIGTENGLNRLNHQTFTFTRYVDHPSMERSIGSGNIFAIEDAGDGLLWVGTGSGLSLMDKKTGSFRHFPKDSKEFTTLPRNTISTLHGDSSGNLWIGTFLNGGLHCLDPTGRSFQVLLKGVTVFSIHRDASGILWVGTQGAGLYRSTNAAATEFIKIIGSENNITAATVSSIQEDGHHQIWINTNTGIYKVHPQTNQITVFNANYGISTGYQSLYGGHRGPGGKIYFGNYDGFYVFSPDELVTNPSPPQLVLTDFRIGGRSILTGKDSPLSRPLEQTTYILLKHYQNVIAFDFAGIHFSNPVNNRHLYKLENYDREWREARAEKTAYYYQLPPGQYRFTIRAASSEGQWAMKTIHIAVASPWWLTPWAYGLYGILFITSTYSFHRYQRQRVIRAERERTREKELAQAKEIEQAYSELKATQAQLIQKEKMASLGELTAGIAHEIQNPLNFINNFSEVSIELVEELREEISNTVLPDVKKATLDEIVEFLVENQQKINQHGKRADAIVKSMLEHSRLSPIEKGLTDINALAIECLQLSYHNLRAKDKDFHANLVTNLDPGLGKVEVVAGEIGRVLLNLFDNAFYATRQKKSRLNGEYIAEITVVTRRQNSHLEISVIDNGTGIPASVKEKIFQPFFTTKPTGQGTGLGLSLSYDIISKVHEGKLRVETKENEWTKFVIELPTGRKGGN